MSDRVRIIVRISQRALGLIDEECKRRSWKRPQVLDVVITEYFEQRHTYSNQSPPVSNGEKT